MLLFLLRFIEFIGMNAFGYVAAQELFQLLRELQALAAFDPADFYLDRAVGLHEHVYLLNFTHMIAFAEIGHQESVPKET